MYALAAARAATSRRIREDPDIFYAGSQGALLTRFDRHTGHMRDVQVYPLFFSGHVGQRRSRSAGSGRSQSSFRRSIPKCSTPHRNISGRPPTKGSSWQTISPDLTRSDPKTLGDSGGPITKDQNGPEIYGTIFTIAPSPARRADHLDRLGRRLGLHHPRRREERGRTITPPALPDFIRVSMIDASPNKPGTAYLAAKNYQARRPPALRLSNRRLRRRRGPRSSTASPATISCTWSAKIPSAPGCCSPERNMAFTFPSTTARTGSRCA